VIKDAHGVRGSFVRREDARASLKAHKMEQKETKKVMGLGGELAGTRTTHWATMRRYARTVTDWSRGSRTILKLWQS
jgi:hypothetical protein